MLKREVWGYDPAWIRCEVSYDADQTFADVWYEPNDALNGALIGGQPSPDQIRREAIVELNHHQLTNTDTPDLSAEESRKNALPA